MEDWTKQHSEHAKSQGWDLFDDGNGLHVEKDDEQNVFVYDVEAYKFVMSKAEEGDETAKLALLYDTEWVKKQEKTPSEPKNLAAVRKWIEENRPDLSELFEQVKNNDGVIAFINIGFEAGREFQKENPNAPDGPAAYLRI